MSKDDNHLPVPIKIESRCHVCQSKLRELIDRMAVEGYRAAYIARHVQDLEPDLSRKSIERHIDRHMTYEQEAIRKLLEERHAEFGNVTDELKTRMITRMAYLDKMIEKGWDQLLRPDTWVKQQDVLKAVELQTQIETTQGSQAVDQLSRQLAAIIQAIKEIVEPEMWGTVVQRAQEIFDAPMLALEPGNEG